MKTGKIDLQEWLRVERVESFSFLFLTADTDMGTEMGCAHTHTNAQNSCSNNEGVKEREGRALSLSAVWCGAVCPTLNLFFYIFNLPPY